MSKEQRGTKSAQDAIKEMKAASGMSTEPEKRKEHTFAELYDIVKRNNIRMPLGTLLIVAPIVEERTAGGIIKPVTVLNNEEKGLAFFKFHRVVAVNEKIEDIKAGEDEVWIDSTSLPVANNGQLAVRRIEVESVFFVRLDYHNVSAIRKGQ